MKKISKVFFMVSVLLVLGSCSDNNVDDIDLNFTPSRPKVKTSNAKLYLYTGSGGDVFEDITAPWVKVGLSLSNGTTKSIVVDKITIKASGASAIGGFMSSDYIIDSESLLVNKNAGDEDDVEVLFAFSPGESSLEPVYIYLGGLPAVTGVYSVEITMHGWFGTVDNPGKAFIQKYYFVTD